jgi:hypothetical protein
MYPGAHQTLKYSDTWSDRVYGALTEVLPKLAEVPKQTKRPTSFEALPQIDTATGFYTDAEGTRWGSARQTMISLGVEEFRKKPEVVNRIESLPSRKMRWGRKPIDAYNLADVNKLFLEDEQLVGYLRKTNDQGFYPDADGTLLGSQYMIATHLGTQNLLHQSEFTDIFTNCPHKKILSKTKLVDGYDLNHVSAAMERSETLSPYLRKVDVSGFYTDPQGVRYAAVRTVCSTLCGGDMMAGDRLRTKIEFKDILRQAQALRILSRSNVVTGYPFDVVREQALQNDKLKVLISS